MDRFNTREPVIEKKPQHLECDGCTNDRLTIRYRHNGSGLCLNCLLDEVGAERELAGEHSF